MSNTIYDFWLMVYQNLRKSSPKGGRAEARTMPSQQKIVMLTDIIENDESKCAIYFPQTKDKVICFLNQNGRRQKDSNSMIDRIEQHFKEMNHRIDDADDRKIIDLDARVFQSLDNINYSYFVIKNVGVANKKGYTIRKFVCVFHVAAFGDAPAAVTESNLHTFHQFVAYHYWFPHWPDHRSPENIDVVLDMCIDLLDSDCRMSAAGDQEAPPAALADQRSTATGPIPIIHW